MNTYLMMEMTANLEYCKCCKNQRRHYLATILFSSALWSEIPTELYRIYRWNTFLTCLPIMYYVLGETDKIKGMNSVTA